MKKTKTINLNTVNIARKISIKSIDTLSVSYKIFVDWLRDINIFIRKQIDIRIRVIVNKDFWSEDGKAKKLNWEIKAVKLGIH